MLTSGVSKLTIGPFGNCGLMLAVRWTQPEKYALLYTYTYIAVIIEPW